MEKRSTDFKKAFTRRLQTDLLLNAYFESEKAPLKICPIHPRMLPMKVWHKAKHHRVANVVNETGLTKAMGLYRMLENTLTNDRCFLVYIYSNGGLYLKIPKEFKECPEQYLKMLAKLRYYLLVVDAKNPNLFSRPVSFEEVRTYWLRRMCDSKGNRNRMQFFGKMSRIALHPLGQQTALLLGQTLLAGLQCALKDG